MKHKRATIEIEQETDFDTPNVISVQKVIKETKKHYFTDDGNKFDKRTGECKNNMSLWMSDFL